MGGTENCDAGPTPGVAEVWDPAVPAAPTARVPMPRAFVEAMGSNWYPFVKTLPKGACEHRCMCGCVWLLWGISDASSSRHCQRVRGPRRVHVWECGYAMVLITPLRVSLRRGIATGRRCRTYPLVALG